MNERSACLTGSRYTGCMAGIDALMKAKRAVGQPKSLLDLELLGRYRRRAHVRFVR